MPKTKAQKIQEALERKRMEFPRHIEKWCLVQKGTPRYDANVEMYGVSYAEQEIVDAEKNLIQQALLQKWLQKSKVN
jgi:hypothetical protein